MTGPALLRTIIANPQDDAPRLVYADWLQEQGDGERAEFIRLQIGLANCKSCDHTGKNVVSPCPCALRQSLCRDLLAAHATGWFEAAEFHPDWYGIGNVTNADGTRHHGGWTDGDRYILADFARGFPASVTCTVADWLAHGDALSWSPEQTECAACGDKPGAYCSHFQVRFPRPMPPTAQPIREVRLTTGVQLQRHLDMSGGTAGFSIVRDPMQFVQPSLVTAESPSARWPAVETWHLPPEPTLGRIVDEQVAFDREHFGRVARRLGVDVRSLAYDPPA